MVIDVAVERLFNRCDGQRTTSRAQRLPARPTLTAAALPPRSPRAAANWARRCAFRSRRRESMIDASMKSGAASLLRA